MQVNGTAVASLPLFIRTKFGDAGFNRWIQSLSEEAAKVYSTTIFPSSWYPLDKVVIEPTRKFCDLFYGGNIKGAWEGGRFSADYGLKGVLKIFVKVASVNILIKKAGMILPTYYKPSNITIIENDKGKACIQITNFPEMDQIIEFRIAGWIERAIEISGGKYVTVIITKSLVKGDPYSEIKITWL